MAERRMFAKKIIDTDMFLDMPLSAQALYFHLSMRADDEGFIGNPKRIRAMIGASEDDLKLLILKQFVIVFESGVVVIKHWKIHNYIQNDRAKETLYIKEKSTLALDEQKAYIELSNPECIQSGYKMDTNCIHRLGKDSIGKDSIEKNRESVSNDTAPKRPIRPTVEEVREYCTARGNSVDAEQFVDFYASKGWKVGNAPMKDWKACVRTWEKREQKQTAKAAQSNGNDDWMTTLANL